MKISKMRKVFPFYEQHGNLVYIGGVQRKLRPDEEDLLFKVLFHRKLNRFGKKLNDAVKALQSNKSVGLKADKTRKLS